MNIKVGENTFPLLFVNSANYAHYENKLMRSMICDTDFISNGYESLSYSMLEEEKYAGFFLLQNTQIIASMVVDIAYLKNVVKLELLCAHSKLPRIHGLMVAFTSYIFHKLQQTIPTTQKIILRVAKHDANPRAVAFYRKIGFVVDEQEDGTMVKWTRGASKSPGAPVRTRSKSQTKSRIRSQTKAVNIKIAKRITAKRLNN